MKTKINEGDKVRVKASYSSMKGRVGEVLKIKREVRGVMDQFYLQFQEGPETYVFWEEEVEPVKK